MTCYIYYYRYYIVLQRDYKAFKNHINPQRNDIYQEQYAIIVYLLIYKYKWTQL